MADEASSIPTTTGAGGTDVQNETPGGGDPGGVDASIPNASGAGATDPRDETPGGGDPAGVDASSIPNTTGAGDE